MLAVVLDLPPAFVKDDKILRSRHINHLDETSYGQTGGAFLPPELLSTHRAQLIYCAYDGAMGSLCHARAAYRSALRQSQLDTLVVRKLVIAFH
jgi:hypothetical protein